jgi:hypothetical protein
LRALLFLLLTALLTGSAVARSAPSPCDVVTGAQLRDALRARPVAPDPATIGEETAPSCIWDAPGGKARVKIEIWSGDELQVVGEATASSYFTVRRQEALKYGGANLFSIGEEAFRGDFGTQQTGEIGVLKDDRFIIFVFEHVPYRRALAFTKAVVRKL